MKNPFLQGSLRIKNAYQSKIFIEFRRIRTGWWHVRLQKEGKIGVVSAARSIRWNGIGHK